MLKSILLAAGLALVAVSAQAVTMNAVIQGTITTGEDRTGVFGAAGADLAGKAVTVTFSFDPDLAAYRETDPSGLFDITLNNNGPVWPSLLAAIRIGGKTRKFNGFYDSGFSIYDNDGGLDSWDGLVDDSGFSDPDPNAYLSSYIQTRISDGSEFLPNGLEEPFHLTAFPGSAGRSGQFSIIRFIGFGATDYATGNFVINSIRVAPVPLPAGGVLLLTGLAAMAAMARRKTRPAR